MFPFLPPMSQVQLLLQRTHNSLASAGSVCISCEALRNRLAAPVLAWCCLKEGAFITPVILAFFLVEFICWRRYQKTLTEIYGASRKPPPQSIAIDSENFEIGLRFCEPLGKLGTGIWRDALLNPSAFLWPRLHSLERRRRDETIGSLVVPWSDVLGVFVFSEDRLILVNRSEQIIVVALHFDDEGRTALIASIASRVSVFRCRDKVRKFSQYSEIEYEGRRPENHHIYPAREFASGE